MENQNNGESAEVEAEIETDKISPWYLMTLIKPVLSDELIAKFRYDRSGIRIAFANGQKFHLKIEEIK